jgi:hypothetical protein
MPGSQNTGNAFINQRQQGRSWRLTAEWQTANISKAGAVLVNTGWHSVNFDDSRSIWTNEGFLVDPHPPSLLDDSSANCSAFIKSGESLRG